MRIRLLLWIALAVLAAAPPVFACGAQYTQEQCRQMDNQDDGSTGDGTGGGGASSCPYYMCGNAVPNQQSAVDWCEATQTYTDCPIAYCRYEQCSGTNCYPRWEICTACSSRSSNNAVPSQCPRQ
jgi:hypothetical protein